MSIRYFRVSWDVNVPGQWYLDHPVDGRGEKIWTWLFQRGEPVQIEGPIRIPIYKPGKSSDYSEVTGTSIPIVHVRVASLLTELAPDDVQILPVQVDSHPEQYCLINVIRVVKCIDDAACAEVRYWRSEDGRPEMVGTYRAVSGLRIDRSRVGKEKVFRTSGWSVAIILSQEIKDALERLGVTGARFDEV